MYGFLENITIVAEVKCNYQQSKKQNHVMAKEINNDVRGGIAVWQKSSLYRNQILL